MFAEIPFETKNEFKSATDLKMETLTRDMRTGFEFGSHDWIHFHHHFTLLCHGCVSLFLTIVYPIAELLSHDCRTNINDPLLGHLFQIGFVGEIVKDLWSVASIIENLCQTQILVLRHMNSIDLVFAKAELLVAGQIFQEVHSDIIYKKTELRFKLATTLP